MKKLTGLSDSVIGPVLYAAVFVAALPALLWMWAERLQHVFAEWRIPIAPGWGALVAGAGLALMLAGMHALWKWGGGLPMNAYPPARFVTAGAYRWLAHPIYTGFALLCFGVSAWRDMAAGFWFVSPLVTAGCMALVWGYERRDLARRFPGAPRAHWLCLPPNDATPADLRRR